MWIVAGILLTLFVLLSLGNATSVVASLWGKQPISAVPFLGGLAGVCGFLVVPISWLGRRWWLPLIVDYGSIPILVIFFIVRAAQSASRDR